MGLRTKLAGIVVSNAEPISVRPASSLNIEEEIEREFRQVEGKIEWNIFELGSAQKKKDVLWMGK